MRKFVLVATLVLASASAQAGVSRGLVLAATDEPVTTEQPKPVTEAPKATEVPKFVERPAAVEPTTDQPKADQAKRTPQRRAERPRHRGLTRARIVYELHRYGIYW
jgi:hypothetical protein